MAQRRVLHMASPTHHANLMIRYMTATKLLAFVPNLEISAVDLPYWNIHLPFIPEHERDRICKIVAEQHFTFTQIQYLFKSETFTRFDWHGYGQRMENFPDKSICRELFRSDEKVGLNTTADCLICPIRAGEILGAIHPGYTIIPVDFYQQIIEESGLNPIFMGQTEDNLYLLQLRRRFPKAEFLPHMGVLQDFQTIRKAKNIVLPVSTFAWLAAWLSEAATIVLPVFGLFNPKSFSLHDLLPVGEASYRFFEFPEQAAVPLEGIAKAHAKLAGQWREVRGFDLMPSRI